MDRASNQSGERRGLAYLLASQPCPAQLSQRREHLNHLLQRHVALIDEIQRSAKVRGYNATQIASLVVSHKLGHHIVIQIVILARFSI